jgi:VanW like protein/Putative peptidoglycan binding domain
MARHRDQTNRWLWVLPSLVIPLFISAIAWTTHVASEGEQIAPNVRFAGIDVSGLAPEEAAEHVGWRETAFLQTPVTIDLGERQVTMTAAEIGFDYQDEATVTAIVSARHEDTAWGEFLAWARTPFRTEVITDEYRFDEEVARKRLSDTEFVLEPPVEPELTVSDGDMAVVSGEDGVGVDVDAVLTDLATADVAAGPVEIVGGRGAVPPIVSEAEAEDAADRANEMTQHDFIAAVGLATTRITPAQVRRHVSGHVVDGKMVVEIDVAGMQDDIERAFPGPRGEMVKPELRVVDGVVEVIREGTPPPVCCSEASIQEAVDLLMGEGAPIYTLETRPSDDDRLTAWADGSQVTEVVSEFTTNHPCCESRVTNIQTMADAVTGYYMVPGETLSFNEYIGPRTREKGYVAAGAIRGGHMTDEVGGGVSQFVTTMFNAAFFGGLELDEYQSHSVYFSRYPFGREATLSVPGPDLVLTNTTDYPVLIWPTYDSNSITVTLYSTRHIEVEELEQRVYRRNQCRLIETDRERSYPDGRVIVDTIIAFYRPGDGIDCNGNEIPKRN